MAANREGTVELNCLQARKTNGAMKSSYSGTRTQEGRDQEADSRAYQLILRLERPTIIVVGALGSHAFPVGTCMYTGSASRGLNKRIKRHLKAEKRLRWHTDYLFEQAQIEGIRVYPGNAAEECSINSQDH